jgi:hypothetical protein
MTDWNPIQSRDKLMPSSNRMNLLPDFRGKRMLKVALRTAHLLSISVVCGGILLGVENTGFHYYWLAGIITGLALLFIDALSNLVWFVQVRGIVILGKIVILSTLPLIPDWNQPIIVLVMLLSGVIAHAPSGWRYYSLIHGKVVKSLHDSKG